MVEMSTAPASAVLISTLTASFLTGIQNNPAVTADVKSKAKVELAGGIPFVSDTDLIPRFRRPECPPTQPLRSSPRTRPRASTGCTRPGR
jgi:hypothetical protein